MTKEQAAREAVEAGTVAVQVVADYGIDSAEAAGALRVANAKTSTALALGCTREDYERAREGR